jgi:hypothetical protein
MNVHDLARQPGGHRGFQQRPPIVGMDQFKLAVPKGISQLAKKTRPRPPFWLVKLQDGHIRHCEPGTGGAIPPQTHQRRLETISVEVIEQVADTTLQASHVEGMHN